MAAIFCFTSTGNNLYAAKKIAEAIGASVLPIGDNPAPCEDDVIGFMFPVYFWGLPRMVTRFLSQLPITRKNAYVFAISTNGGSAFGYLNLVKGLLKEKGIPLQYGASLKSVTNYIPAHTINDTEDLRRRMEQRLLQITGNVKNRASRRISPFYPFNRLFFRLCPDPGSDRHFTVSSGCTGCGTCQKVCPVKNITMEGEGPCFQHRCEHCLGCLHACPAKAIDWMGKTQGKERYRNPGITLDDLISFHG